MNYSVRIVGNVSNEIVRLPERVKLVSGTYAANGTDICELYVTYNYSPIFRELFGENGLNRLNGMEVGEAQRLLLNASERLTSEGTKSGPISDYWKCTKGNVRRAIGYLIVLCEFALMQHISGGIRMEVG